MEETVQKISSALIQALLLLASVLYLLSAGILFTGCAAQKKVAAKIVIPRHCMTAIQLTDHTRCTGADLNTMHCTGLTLTQIKGCETLQIEKEKLEHEK